MQTELNYNSLNERAANIIRAAVQVGWTVRVERNTIVLSSPQDRTVTLPIPMHGSLNDRKADSMYRKVMRYGDPVKRLALAAMIDNIELSDHPSVTITPDSPLAADSITLEPAPEPPAPRAPYVVSEHPWIARKGSTEKGGTGYQSKAVTERKWSDGTLDYICTIPGCGFTNAVPQTVGRHYAQSKNSTHPPLGADGQALQVVIPPYEPKHVGGRVDRLAREIRAALAALSDHGTYSQDALAKAVAEQIVRHRDETRATHEDDAEPLTAEQVLERIRRMVDGGEYLARMQQIEDLQTQMAALREEVQIAEANCIEVLATQEQVQAELAAARKRAEDAEAKWSSLRELIQEG